jgi:hypothetical protein
VEGEPRDWLNKNYVPIPFAPYINDTAIGVKVFGGETGQLLFQSLEVLLGATEFPPRPVERVTHDLALEGDG